jgi:hypothetical protein
MEYTVFKPRKGKQIRQENMDSKLYPLSFKGFKHLHNAENEKHFKELKIKSGSSHLWVKPFFNSEILLISLLCSMMI